ncbi:MAG TPA: hypothetical protein VMZ52_02120 [Bryobacteraceae bacterium]|nr:hypothetical protein [Bryobacteraceae bacterium]
MSDPASSFEKASDDLLDSWKEIASFLGKGVRTVMRWEKTEGLPVHRHLHERRSSVFAYKSEIEAWWESRRAVLDLPQSCPTPIRRPRPVKWAALLSIISIAGVAVWLLLPSRLRTLETPLNFQPLTSYPGVQYAPSFSPDGNHFAFAFGPPGQGDTDIYVQAIGSAEPKRLTQHPDVEFSPAWSPDGKWIAFLRRSRQFRSEVLLIPSLGGAERKVAELKVAQFMDAPQLSWSPDGKWLAFADAEADQYGIFSLAPETGERRRLTKAQGPRGDLDPAFSPDGRHLAFRRGESESQAEIYLQPLTEDGRPAGEPERLTYRGVRSTSPVWSGDCRAIFFSSGIFNSGADNIYRVPVIPRTSAPPQRLTASNAEAAFSLATSWRGGLLAYTLRQLDLNIWAVEKEGQAWKQPGPIPLLSSTRSEQDPAFSPDGRQLAFISGRSGNLELWLAQRDGSHARKLTSFEGAYTASPRWSPDGRQITFSVLWKDVCSIWTIDAGGGPPRKLAEPGWSSSFSRDGRWIYYSTGSRRSPGIFKIRSQGGGTPSQVIDTSWQKMPGLPQSSSERVADPGPANQRGWEIGDLAAESPDGGVLFFKRPDGVWRHALGSGRTELVAKVDWYTPFAVCDAGLFFHGPGNPSSNRRTLQYFRFADAATVEVAQTGPRPPLGLAASPDCNTVLFSQVDHDVMSLMYVRGLW